jgi:RNA polymerase sigma factor (sigma-70 family)
MERTRINAIMQRAAAGDDAAFGALAAAVQDELFRLALAQGLPREDAAEATQETLTRAYARRSGWREGSDAVAWLCGIAMNVVREYRRRRRRAATWQASNGAAACAAPATDAQLADGGDREQLWKMMDAVAALPARQREAVACRFLRRMSIRQTAEAMRCAEGTVKSAVAAALARLRSILEKQR